MKTEISNIRKTLSTPGMQQQIKAALPPQIDPERFTRVAMTAIQSAPTLLNQNRESLFGACIKAAQDGLLPDGKEAALVPFKGQVQYMPMLAGILKKVRNSGELLTISAHVVHEADDFEYELGDEERIYHKPFLGANRGEATLAYAIAKTKDGGIYREVMTKAEIEQVRESSRARNGGPWSSWWSEMAKKTVIRRLSKRLPMSTDLEGIVNDPLMDPDTPLPSDEASAHTPSNETAQAAEQVQEVPKRNSKLQAAVDQASQQAEAPAQMDSQASTERRGEGAQKSAEQNNAVAEQGAGQTDPTPVEALPVDESDDDDII